MADENTNLSAQTPPPRPNDSVSKSSSAIIGLEEILKDLPPKIVNPSIPSNPSPLNQAQAFTPRPPAVTPIPSQGLPFSSPSRTGGLTTPPLSNIPQPSNQQTIKGEVRTMKDDLS